MYVCMYVYDSTRPSHQPHTYTHTHIHTYTVDTKFVIFKSFLTLLWALTPTMWYLGSRWMGLSRLQSSCTAVCKYIYAHTCIHTRLHPPCGTLGQNGFGSVCRNDHVQLYVSIFMRIYIYIYIYIYIVLHLHGLGQDGWGVIGCNHHVQLYVSIFMHAHMHSYTHVFVTWRLCIHASAITCHIYICVIHTYIHIMLTCVIHTYIYILYYVCLYIYIYIYIHTHTYCIICWHVIAHMLTHIRSMHSIDILYWISKQIMYYTYTC